MLVEEQRVAVGILDHEVGGPLHAVGRGLRLIAGREQRRRSRPVAGPERHSSARGGGLVAARARLVGLVGAVASVAAAGIRCLAQARPAAAGGLGGA